jgi:glycine/D-amino acid oxidase-like deaminating enzyme
MPIADILVVGAGIFGLSAALELKSRGYRVHLLDPGPVPHPLAASTDISKVIRMEYGADEGYMALMEEARKGWLSWNERWQTPLYHETGVLMICREPMAPGGFEYESWLMLRKRGHRPERMDSKTLKDRFPAWNTDVFVDGFYHASGGYAESGRVVERLAVWAAQEGVAISTSCLVTELTMEKNRVVGVRDQNNRTIPGDRALLAAGAWNSRLAPGLDTWIQPTGHPVFHLKPERPERFLPSVFPTYTADVRRTGFYGFPLHPEGVVKVANHGAGVRIDPDAPRAVTEEDYRRLRRFLERAIPELAQAEVVHTRLCLYADTPDGDFLIGPAPGCDGVTVAGGGSGHAFKFGPVLGGLIADAVEQKDNPFLSRFAWPRPIDTDSGREAARSAGGDNPI